MVERKNMTFNKKTYHFMHYLGVLPPSQEEGLVTRILLHVKSARYLNY